MAGYASEGPAVLPVGQTAGPSTTLSSRRDETPTVTGGATMGVSRFQHYPSIVSDSRNRFRA
jgi:hypothetical protein